MNMLTGAVQMWKESCFFLAADVLIFVFAALSAQTPKPSNICPLRKHSVGLALKEKRAQIHELIDFVR